VPAKPADTGSKTKGAIHENEDFTGGIVVETQATDKPRSRTVTNGHEPVAARLKPFQPKVS
jgi:hypothetical protein